MQNHFANFAKPFCPLHVLKNKETITNKFGKTSPNAIFKNALSNSLKALVCIAKQRPEKSAVCIGDPKETRTPVLAVRGRCPRPLDDGTVMKTSP